MFCRLGWFHCIYLQEKINTLKRSYSKGGSQGEGLNEVGKSGSSKGRSYSDAQIPETDNSSHIPFIKQADNARLLPRYTAGKVYSNDDRFIVKCPNSLRFKI